VVSTGVPFLEAVQILSWIGQAPGRVRAVRCFDDGSFGPLPFLVEWKGADAEVTLELTGGVVTGLASIRIGVRFSNYHDWIGEAEGSPLDTLTPIACSLLEASLRSADPV
jgi:hypothetical protein